MKTPLFVLLILAASTAIYAGPMGYNEKNPKAPVLPPPTPPAPSCEISYDFLEAGWNHVIPDAGSAADGYYLYGNKSINDHLYGFLSGGETFPGVDQYDVAAGLGFHTPVFRCFDWVTKVGCLYESYDGFSDFGYTVGTGFRISLTRWLEVDTFYHFSQVFDGDDELNHSGTASLVFKELVIPKLDTVVSGVYADDGTSVSVGLRYNF